MDNINYNLPDSGFEERTIELDKVFVYGTLKSTGVRDIMSLVDEDAKATIVGKTKTKYPDYQMMDLGAFPGVVDGGTKHIQGELYEAWMYYLDKEYGQDLGINLDTRNTDRIEEVNNTLIWHN
jgi:gamma-glutamylcyclotransferase (GGCT)/AIG2-like uncharacterized protein YtfP